MKKNYFLAVALLATNTLMAQTAADSLTFESYDLNGNDFYHGVEGTPIIQIGTFGLSNNYNDTWGSWSGFSISKVKDDVTDGYGNQYASFANGGSNSDQYGVSYGESTISFGEARKIKSLQVTNTTYTALSMRDGDAFSKKFGSIYGSDGVTLDGTDGKDWFKLAIIPLDENGDLSADTVFFYLADYRFEDDADDYIVKAWTTIDMQDVEASSLKFELTSSDNGAWGMNTPAYFVLDNLVLQPKNMSIVKNNQLVASIYPNPNNGIFSIQTESDAQMQLVNTFGQVVVKQSITNKAIIDVQHLPAGIYQLQLVGDKGTYTQKISLQ
jgi:hypothetical protein